MLPHSRFFRRRRRATETHGTDVTHNGRFRVVCKISFRLDKHWLSESKPHPKTTTKDELYLLIKDRCAVIRALDFAFNKTVHSTIRSAIVCCASFTYRRKCIAFFVSSALIGRMGMRLKLKRGTIQSLLLHLKFAPLDHARRFFVTCAWTTGQTTVNKRATIRYIIPINDMVHRPL